MKPSIIFFGTESFSLTALQALVEADYDIALVVTKPDQPHGRGMNLRAPVVKTYALEHNLRVVQPDRLSDIHAEIEAIADHIGVLSSFGKIIPAATLDLFDRGIINIHPSLLPNYRGPSPIETVIYNGDAETGVSIMRLVSAMDAGPIYAQKTIVLNNEITSSDLYTICAQTGSQLLLEVLPQIISGDNIATPQDDSVASYTQLLHKKDGLVDPRQQSAELIMRHIRAYEVFPRTRMQVAGHDVIVVKAHMSNAGAPGLTIPCIDNSWLTIDTLIAPSGKKITGDEFTRGYLNK